MGGARGRRWAARGGVGRHGVLGDGRRRTELGRTGYSEMVDVLDARDVRTGMEKGKEDDKKSRRQSSGSTGRRRTPAPPHRNPIPSVLAPGAAMAAMTPPFLPPLSAAYEFVRCASGCDSWAPHHVRLDGDLCRLCSSCVLLSNPDAYCSACLFLLSPSAYAAASQEAHIDFSPGDTALCSSCGTFVAHVSCIADPYSFVCPPCAAAFDKRAFS
ncbi:hypothetical protein ACQ4PT_058626 [Festuca glaucescens]